MTGKMASDSLEPRKDGQGGVRRPVAGKIFINYRRGDDAGFTQALYLRLESEFGADNLFMDVEGHIKPGDDFVRVLDAQVAASDIVLAVIGPRWSDLMAKRESDPDDFVAIEIKSALDQGKRVIPVLVGGAMMPKADVLPPSISAMARRNAVGLRPDRFKADVQGLVGALKEQLADAERERDAKTMTERLAAEAARKQREAEDAARAAAAEVRGREQRAAGLTAEEIRKAEELANWDFIKDSNQQQEFRDHLARFPKGVVERNVRAKLEAVLWDSIVNAAGDDLFIGERLASFQTEFPDGKFAADAKAMRAKFEEQAHEASKKLDRLLAEKNAWADASAANAAADYKAFLKAWPDGEHAAAAKDRLKELKSISPIRRVVLVASVATLAALGIFLGQRTMTSTPKKQEPPPKILTLADAEARFPVVNDAIKAKKTDLNTVSIEGQERSKPDGTYESPLDSACIKDQRGMSALRGMAIVFALYGLASNGLVESGADIPSIDYGGAKLRRLAITNKDASWNSAMALRIKLPNWVQNSTDIKAFLKELLAYKSKFDEKEKSVDWAKKSAEYEDIAGSLGDPQSDKPCYNSAKFLNVGAKSKDNDGYWYTYGIVNPHGYFYSFWNRRKLEGSTDFAEKFLKLYVGS